MLIIKRRVNLNQKNILKEVIMMNRKIIFLLWACLIFASTLANAQPADNGGFPPNILHVPVIRADENSPIEIEATITDQDDDLDQVLLYYKKKADDAFSYAEMYRQGDIFTGTIPARYAVTEGVEYYIEVMDSQGNKTTFPSVNPMQNPAVINITPSEMKSVEPEIDVLSPQPDELVNPNNVVIALALYDPQNDIDLSTVRLIFNTRDVTDRAYVTPTMITFVPTPPLESGVHKVEVEVRDEAGNEADPVKFYFEVSEFEKEEKWITVKGNLKISSKYDNISGEGKEQRNEPEWENNLRLNLQGNAKWFDYKANLFLTSNEDDEFQPRNRYRLDLINPYLEIKLGDVNPSFSYLTINGQRVRGFETKMMLSGFHVSYFLGDSKRSIQNKGVFSRNTYGLRATIVSKDRFVWGTSFIKAEDDTSSIDMEKAAENDVFITNSKDNLVVSSDMQFRFGKNFVVINGEVATSFLTENTRNPEPEDEELPTWVTETIGEFLVINSSTLKPSVYSTAFRLDATNHYKFNTFNAYVKSIGPTYRSIVNSTLQNDEIGFGVSDRLRLFQNRLSLSLNYETYDDNMAEDKQTTTTTSSFGSTLNVQYSHKYPSVNLSIRTFNRVGEDETIVDNGTTTVSFGSNYSFPLLRARNMVNLNFVQMSYTDNIYPNSDFDNNSFLLGITSMPNEMPLSVSLGFGYNQNKSEVVTTTFNTLSLRGSYKLLDKKLLTRLSTNLISGSRDDDTLASQKIGMELGGDYSWTPTRSVGMALGFISYTDDENSDSEYNETILKAFISQKF
jgi:hypothetical protein